ncbi:MAG TPA: cyclase family protein [Bacteroidetes bacterium]|nr:cyclase family protein [Bacteroidota bacterium]
MSRFDGLIDATLTLGTETPVFPGDPSVQVVEELSLKNGDPVNLRWYRLSGHHGTHVDAPRHLFDEGKDVASLDPARFVGDAWVVDVPTEGAISARDLENRLPGEGKIYRVLIRTRASEAWQERRFDNFPIPYLLPAAARFLMDRRIQLVGIDSLSVDPVDSEDLPSHKIILGQGVPIIEGLDLSRAPLGPVQVIALPLRLAGADGAPVRVLIGPAGP